MNLHLPIHTVNVWALLHQYLHKLNNCEVSLQWGAFDLIKLPSELIMARASKHMFIIYLNIILIAGRQQVHVSTHHDLRSICTKKSLNTNSSILPTFSMDENIHPQKTRWGWLKPSRSDPHLVQERGRRAASQDVWTFIFRTMNCF